MANVSPKKSNSYEEAISVESLTRFMVIHSKKDAKPLSALSPFVIAKIISGSIGTPKRVPKNLRSCYHLIE